MQASTRGTTSLRSGSAPSARMASTCSVTVMAPSSAAMPQPMRAPTVSAVSTGASSRKSVSTTTRPTVYCTPKRPRKKPNCREMTSPANVAVSSAMGSERTPSASMW